MEQNGLPEQQRQQSALPKGRNIKSSSGHGSRGGGRNTRGGRSNRRQQPRRLPRQDSGLSDSSDHSGISEHSGISSVSSQHSRPSTASQNNQRGMYARQDSGRSFSSMSSGTSYSSDESFSVSSEQKFMHNYKKPVMPQKSQYVALDCEMVGTLTGKSLCARVVLVDWKGRTVLDQYVKPTEPITDYRTFVSGITQEQIENAPSLAEVRPIVQAKLSGKILVGHGLANDLECLGVEHPWHLIRDTALYEPFMKMHYGQLNPRKLKELAKEKLQKDIQVEGEAHSPTEDAIAALDLYKSHRPRWESCMTSQIKEGQRLLVEQHKQREQYEQFFSGLPVIAFTP